MQKNAERVTQKEIKLKKKKKGKHLCTKKNAHV